MMKFPAAAVAAERFPFLSHVSMPIVLPFTNCFLASGCPPDRLLIMGEHGGLPQDGARVYTRTIPFFILSSGQLCFPKGFIIGTVIAQILSSTLVNHLSIRHRERYHGR